MKKKSSYVLIQLLSILWGKDLIVKRRLILSLFLTFVLIVFNVSIPLVFKNIINSFSLPAQSSFFMVRIFLVLYGFLWTTGQIIGQLKSVAIFRCLERSARDLSIKIFDHLHTLSLRFHLDRKTGDVTNTIERAQFGLEMVFWGLFLFLLPNVIEMIVVIILLTFFYGFFYSEALVFVMFFYLIFSLVAISKLSEKQKVYNQKRSAASSFIVDSLLNFETVKYFGNENYDHELCNKILQEQEEAGVKRSFTDAMINIGQAFVIGAGLVYLTVASGNAVISGRMNISDFVLINGYLLQFAIPLHGFGYVLRQVRRGLNDMSGVMDLLKMESEVKDFPNAKDLKIDKAEIKFENVVFGYNNQRQILNGISFSVPAGKTIAIVGATGSGKSTISRLLFRFYDVCSGSISINGYDIRNITQKSLHALIGVVPQDTVLFNNTLYYNISYGCSLATPQDVEMAIKFAHLDDFIKRLPEGCNTIVGERGLKLSGGEKQRVAIARVILKRPKIYIFDEATSSLDINTEREIQNNLEEISKGSTTLIIAHRLATVINADEIFVLDKGVVIECGKHKDLLQQDGFYASLWNKQMQSEKNA